MTERGWVVTVESDGSVSAEYPSSQEEAYDADFMECLSIYGYDQPLPPMTEEQAAAYLDALLEVGKCVRDLGFTTPDPPSEEAAIESLVSSRDPLWDPYGDVIASQVAADIQRVTAECPLP